MSRKFKYLLPEPAPNPHRDTEHDVLWRIPPCRSPFAEGSRTFNYVTVLYTVVHFQRPWATRIDSFFLSRSASPPPLECNSVSSHSIMNKIPAGYRKGVCPSMQVLNREAQRWWRRTVQWKEELLEHNVKHNVLHALPEASPFCRGPPPTHTYCPLFGLILSSGPLLWTHLTALILLVLRSKDPLQRTLHFPP